MTLKQIYRCLVPNPFDSLLRRAVKDGAQTFLLAWNRGLGDIPLGLYGLVFRIRQYIENPRITFLTRKDLADGFKFLDGIEVFTCEKWKRKEVFNFEKTLKSLGLKKENYDVIIEHPDPTYWLKWQLGALTPKLSWNKQWDMLWSNFPALKEEKYIGIHIQTETKYGYEKNWPLSKWMELFLEIKKHYKIPILLFGFQKTPQIEMENVIDLRGETNLLELLSIIKNRCSFLIVPDSGILSFTYYLDLSFPIKIISLWADPRQGILKQAVRSPNENLEHIPLIGENKKIDTISVKQVIEGLTIER